MDFIFVDDARQSNPSRPGLGPLVAMGGVYVPSDQVGPLEQALRSHCTSIGFPADQQFKWSPGKKEVFMKSVLVDDHRLDFYRCVLGIARGHGAECCVVIEDTTRRPARPGLVSHEQDVASLFLERVQWTLSGSARHGLVVAASPSGGPKDQEKFLTDCAELLHHGTEYVKFDWVFEVLTARARKLRLLQLADVITSCTVSRVSGETNYSPAIWELLRPMWRRSGNRIQGVGLKLHPDYVFANLYHWLLGEPYIWKGNTGHPLPIKNFPYYEDAGEVAPLSP